MFIMDAIKRCLKLNSLTRNLDHLLVLICSFAVCNTNRPDECFWSFILKFKTFKNLKQNNLSIITASHLSKDLVREFF